MSDIIKQDLNFLDKYLWLPVPRKSAQNGMTVIDDEGYTYQFLSRAPEKFDILVFLYALLKSQEEGYKEEMEFTRYEILKACGYPTDDGRYYDRLEESLRRWANVTIEFKGTFYDGKEYLFLIFHLLNKAEIDKKTKKVKIVFSKDWLLKVKESNFFRYLHFNYYKALKRPVSRRLFEILPAKLYYRNTWEIGLVKLAKNIGLPGKQVKTKDGYETTYYPSLVLQTILPCIKEMNTLSGDKRKLKHLGLKPKDAFLVDHELFTSQQGEKSIRFIKKEVPKDPIEKVEVKAEEIPPRIRDLVTPQYIHQQWKKALAWVSDLEDFEERRLNEVKGFPKHVVALIFERVKWKYDNKKIRTAGGIFRAFKKGWYLSDIIALLEEKRGDAEKKEHKQEAKNFAEELNQHRDTELQETARKQRETEEQLRKTREQVDEEKREEHKKKVLSCIKKHGKKNLLLLGEKIKRIEQKGIVTINKHKQERLIAFGNVVWGSTLTLIPTKA